MKANNNTQFRHAILVRDWLTERFLNIRGVKLIDIGYITDPKEPGRKVVIRIHVDSEETLKSIKFPESAMGIPVQVLVSDIKLE